MNQTHHGVVPRWTGRPWWSPRALRLLRQPGFLVAILSVVLAFGFLGTRGIWDPDEGRYTNVALNMLSSGDWITPRRHHEVGHWTKPPMTYWAIAGSIAMFGANAWAARLPAALAYLVCVLMVWRIAARIAPGHHATAATVYATMLLTVGAAQFITSDYLLAAFETAAMWSFVESRFGAPAQRPYWLVAMWVALAAAFLTKGPPALLPLAVAVAFDHCMPARGGLRLFRSIGALLFAFLALPWYIAVIQGHPGLLRYFLGDEVVNRIATSEFSRHSGWFDWAWIYIPTLLLGTLPWTKYLLHWLRRLPKSMRGWWRDSVLRAESARHVLVALWLLLPLAVFCIARSRMPLYLLPLFTPLALIIAMEWGRQGRNPPRVRVVAAWVLVLLALRLAIAFWPTHKDASQWADAIRERTSAPLTEVIFVEDMARYGLHLHLGPRTEIEKISLEAIRQSAINPEYDDPLAHELSEREPNTLWICKERVFPNVKAKAGALGYRVTQLGTPYKGRVFFTIE